MRERLAGPTDSAAGVATASCMSPSLGDVGHGFRTPVGVRWTWSAAVGGDLARSLGSGNVTDLNWEPIDERAVNTARVLAADAVEKVGNGHPGTAISLAPLAYLLFQKVMKR